MEALYVEIVANIIPDLVRDFLTPTDLAGELADEINSVLVRDLLTPIVFAVAHYDRTIEILFFGCSPFIYKYLAEHLITVLSTIFALLVFIILFVVVVRDIVVTFLIPSLRIGSPPTLSLLEFESFVEGP
jgi:hypothetical protein